MPSLSDLELPEIDLFDPNFSKDPHGVYRRARETGAWMAKYQFGYIPLDYETVKFFMRADTWCRTPNRDITMMWDAQGSVFARFNDNMLMALGGESHARLRRLVAPAFTPREANLQRPLMRETFRQVIAPTISKGECEFVEAITKYPITVICRLIGVPTEDIDLFRHWVDGLDAAFGQDASILPRLNDVTGKMFAYVDKLIERRKAAVEKTQDLLQTLLDLSENGDSLSSEELKCLLIILLGGGFDTTRNQLVLLMYLMTQHPEYWKRAADDPAFVKPLIEECLRFFNPIGATHRVTNVDTEYRGVTIPANTFITLTQAVPGRDPAVNPDPERFDPERKSPVHLSFGQGMHMCVGMFLARALLEEAIPVLARSMLDPKLSGDLKYRHPMGVWGLQVLPITFTPGQL